jgi:ElaB/YqjD/DUF883 family membrane-anchored ribosome-binding protein
MKFCNIAVPMLAMVTGVMASGRPPRVATQAIQAAEMKAEESLETLKDDGCDVMSCVFAVADTVGSCAMALVDPNPVSHIGCLAAVGKEITNPPKQCSSCV